MWAHPRAGGENQITDLVPDSLEGSSPRGRGKRDCSRRRCQRERLIPARAGKTGIGLCAPLSAPAHPRAGGENVDHAHEGFRCAGSSPRGRGKLERRSRPHAVPGLIPARAGKTLGWSLLRRVQRAHPRAGGENVAFGAQGLDAAGSSPRGRGKHRRDHAGRGPVRLIPARAGKTHPATPPEPATPAHPRAGGENRMILSPALPSSGSSPRGRGKLEGVEEARAAARLIPARAGKTTARKEHFIMAGAHPRAGGENGERDSRRGHRVRLIPARAGKTNMAGITGQGTTAHPRAGGENPSEVQFLESRAGSSPRGRGKPCIRHRRAGRQRLIPARAGKTSVSQVIVLDIVGSSPRGRGKRRRRV